ncbi:hypothetical protein DKW60_07470 [Leucothrix pacifica]|uniref:RNA polymerase sigma-70 region 2 domain-containing protein n=2 Tax=Leucothrix pacifica TaxID=1247513 RepID=A0A317CK48_9GAMM|nr:hypothetical protein DKW60_07470 [Leucothrix pacifica]
MQDKALSSSHETSCTDMLCHLLDQNNDHGAAMMNLIEHYINHFNQRYANLEFHERQDIRQDIAIKLISQGHKVRDNCSRAWVYTVVRNQCINHIRSKSKHLSIPNAQHYTDVESNETGLIPSLDEGHNVRLLQQMDCLQKIFDQIEAKETGKADVAMYTQYAFGLSYKEISKCSKRRVDAIGRRISILKKRLKKLAEECC